MTSTAKPAQRTCRLWATVILLPVLFACLSSCYHNSHRITAEGILKRTHTRDYVETEIHQNKAGTITGDTVVVAAGQGDINATGMHIVSDHGTMLHTDKGDINLKAGKNSYRSVEKHSKHKTGLMGSGGWGVFLGSRRQSGETELNIKAPAPTLVGAIDGNIHIQAGGHYDGMGALVHAGREGGPLTKEQ